MPTVNDALVSLIKWEDGILTLGLSNPTPIGGWSLRFTIQHRFGGLSGIVTRTCASGYGGGQSGITITNSGQGVMNITLNSSDFSGYQPGAYAMICERMDSGFRTVLVEGFYLNGPPGPP